MSMSGMCAARRALLAGVFLSAAAAAQNTIWVEQLGSGFHDDSLIAVDGSGGAYVGGMAGGNLGGGYFGTVDAWLGRYDASGNALWLRQYGTAQDEAVRGLVPDGSGGVFAAGYTGDALFGTFLGGFHDAWLTRHDGAGNLLWSVQFGTDAEDAALALASDGAGGVFVAGDTQGSLGGPYNGPFYSDAWIARFDASGAQLWARQLGTQSRDEVWTVASDGAGGAFVGGLTYGNLVGQSAGYIDVWFAHYDAFGTQSWVRQIGSTEADYLLGATADGAGGVVLCGWTAGALMGDSLGDLDAWVARFDASGQALWERQMGTSELDYAQSIAPHPLSGFYVTGGTTGSFGGPALGDHDVWVRRFLLDGEAVSTDQFGTASRDMPMGIASETVGSYLIAGQTLGDMTGTGANAGAPDAWFSKVEDPCGSGLPYCNASSTSIPGCFASIQGAGVASLSNPGGFTISSGNIPGGLLGVGVFSASGTASFPFGTLGGKVCFLPPIFRTTAVLGGGTPGVCDGLMTLTLQDLIDASPIITAGAVVQVEYWARDPDNADGFLLSNGLQFAVCP